MKQNVTVNDFGGLSWSMIGCSGCCDEQIWSGVTNVDVMVDCKPGLKCTDYM